MKARHWIPFGLAEKSKPRHYRKMVRAAWENRRALPSGEPDYNAYV